MDFGKKESKDFTRTISIEPESIINSKQNSDIKTIEESERYNLKEEVGRGGIGRVLVAFDQRIGREIAIKELLKKDGQKDNSPLSDKMKNDKMRFLREAMVTGQLEHPGIVPVYEIGQDEEGNQYYTMKLVRGVTLSDAINNSDTLEKRLRLLPHFRDICNAVAYAHSKGVIHRDIKPENIMIGEFGETVVIDWGLAKVKGQIDENEGELRDEINLLIETEHGKTAKGKAIGTPAYMSPEQAKGDISEIDERSDIYSLGAVLYEILTGHAPFEGKNARETVAMVMNGNLIAISDLEPDAPADLCAVVEKTLTANKKMRYQTAIEVAKEIENFMAGGKIKAYEYSSWELLKRFVHKNKSLSFLIGILIAILIAGSAVILYAYRNSVHNERIAHLNLSMGYLEYAERLLSEKKYGDANIFSAAALYHNPYNKKSPWSFPSVYLSEKQEEVSNYMLSIQSALYLSSVYQNDAFKSDLFSVPFEVRNIDVSPDGSMIAVSGKNMDIRIYAIQGMELKAELRGHKDEITDIKFSPDGKLFASGSWDNSLKIWNIKEQRMVKSVTIPNCEIYTLSFSPDSKSVVFGGTDRTVRIVEIENLSSISMPVFDTANSVRSVEWSPCGKKIIASDIEGRIYLKEDKNETVVLRGHTEAVISLKFLKNSDHFVSAGYDKRIIIWNEKERKPGVIINHWDAFFDLNISNDGQFIAAATRDGVIKLLNLDTMQSFELRGHEGAVHSVVFLPMGDTVISAGDDRIIKSWRTDISKQVFTYSGHKTYIPAIAYSPDDKYIVSSSWDFTIKLWEVKNESLISSFGDQKTVALSLTFSPDGQFLVSGDTNGEINIWNPINGKKLSSLKGHSDSVTATVFDPSGKKLFSGGRDRIIKIWDSANMKHIEDIKIMDTPIHALAISHDGQFLAVGGRNGELRLLNMKNGDQKKIEGHTKTIHSLSFSPDKKYFLSTGEDGFVIKWDLDDKITKNVLKGHTGPVNEIVFSKSGKMFASIGSEVILRDGESGEKLQIIDLQFSGYSLSFEKDEKYISVSDGALIKRFPIILDIWKENPENLLTEVETRTGKTLEGFRLVPKKN
jgi:eukaryotic-like serine/threonine-protein kinase